jgi:hypothetical protein
MKRQFALGACMTLAVVFGMVVFAQSAGQAPAPQPQTSSAPAEVGKATPQTGQQATITGCLQREEDYRRAHNLGRGGAAGTSVGVANEFVLVAGGEATTGTAGSTAAASGAQAFELTGANESQGSQFVGKRVEVVGRIKPAEMGPTGTTGGATAGSPPTGVDIMSPDLKLRELEVTSYRETSGSCPSAPTER